MASKIRELNNDIKSLMRSVKLRANKLDKMGLEGIVDVPEVKPAKTIKEAKQTIFQAESFLRRTSPNTAIRDVSIKARERRLSQSGRNKVKRVEDMNLNQLREYARTSIKGANRKLREFEMQGLDHLTNVTNLFNMADRYGLRTPSDRISTKIEGYDEAQLRDLITETRNNYIGVDIGKMKDAFEEKRWETEEMLKTRFGIDYDKLDELSDKQFAKLYSRLNAGVKSDGRAANSDEIILDVLKNFNVISDDEYDVMERHLIEREEFMNRMKENEVTNRELGRNVRRGGR